ncbi:hypothetical protein CGC20_23860 [Leishmania donovani]|uniref:Uncharacterized protein n=1 Tax=Leishmania donovani TaxID=5661 RepID=A0A504XAV9_LEIDO|nr:hypothetical protein CGC20_23860 [Leishmania donovani]
MQDVSASTPSASSAVLVTYAAWRTELERIVRLARSIAHDERMSTAVAAVTGEPPVAGGIGADGRCSRPSTFSAPLAQTAVTATAPSFLQRILYSTPTSGSESPAASPVAPLPRTHGARMGRDVEVVSLLQLLALAEMPSSSDAVAFPSPSSSRAKQRLFAEALEAVSISIASSSRSGGPDGSPSGNAAARPPSLISYSHAILPMRETASASLSAAAAPHTPSPASAGTWRSSGGGGDREGDFGLLFGRLKHQAVERSRTVYTATSSSGSASSPTTVLSPSAPVVNAAEAQTLLVRATVCREAQLYTGTILHAVNRCCNTGKEVQGGPRHVPGPHRHRSSAASSAPLGAAPQGWAALTAAESREPLMSAIRRELAHVTQPRQQGRCAASVAHDKGGGDGGARGATEPRVSSSSSVPSSAPGATAETTLSSISASPQFMEALARWRQVVEAQQRSLRMEEVHDYLAASQLFLAAASPLMLATHGVTHVLRACGLLLSDTLLEKEVPYPVSVVKEMATAVVSVVTTDAAADELGDTRRGDRAVYCPLPNQLALPPLLARAGPHATRVWMLLVQLASFLERNAVKLPWDTKDVSTGAAASTLLADGSVRSRTSSTTQLLWELSAAVLLHRPFDALQALEDVLEHASSSTTAAAKVSSLRDLFSDYMSPRRARPSSSACSASRAAVAAAAPSAPNTWITQVQAQPGTLPLCLLSLRRAIAAAVRARHYAEALLDVEVGLHLLREQAERLDPVRSDGHKAEPAEEVSEPIRAADVAVATAGGTDYRQLVYWPKAAATAQTQRLGSTSVPTTKTVASAVTYLSDGVVLTMLRVLLIFITSPMASGEAVARLQQRQRGKGSWWRRDSKRRHASLSSSGTSSPSAQPERSNDDPLDCAGDVVHCVAISLISALDTLDTLTAQLQLLERYVMVPQGSAAQSRAASSKTSNVSCRVASTTPARQPHAEAHDRFGPSAGEEVYLLPSFPSPEHRLEHIAATALKAAKTSRLSSYAAEAGTSLRRSSRTVCTLTSSARYQQLKHAYRSRLPFHVGNTECSATPTGPGADASSTVARDADELLNDAAHVADVHPEVKAEEHSGHKAEEGSRFSTQSTALVELAEVVRELWMMVGALTLPLRAASTCTTPPTAASVAAAPTPLAAGESWFEESTTTATAAWAPVRESWSACESGISYGEARLALPTVEPRMEKCLHVLGGRDRTVLVLLRRLQSELLFPAVDIVAPPAAASTSLSTSQGAAFGSACGDADECSSRRVGIGTSLTSATDAQQRMRGNPMVAPLPGPTTEQLRFAESHAFANAVPSDTEAGKSLNSSSTLQPRGRRGHAHGDTAGASTSREAISINSVKSSRSTGCGGGRSAHPEAPQALGQVSEPQNTASLTSLHTTSPPATPSAAAGASESSIINHKPARRPRINKKAAEVGVLRTGRRLSCAAASTSSTTTTSTTAFCRGQNMIASLMPSAQHRQRRRLSSPASSAPSLTAQDAFAVNQHEVKTGAASGRARIAGMSAAFTEIASAAAAASANTSVAVVAATTRQLRFLHECRASSTNASTASSAPPALPTRLRTRPLPMHFSSRCRHGAHRYADENAVALARAGGANDAQSLSLPLAPSVLCAFALPHYRHYSQVQQASSPRSEDGSPMLWRESRCGFSRVEQVSAITAEETQEPCVTDHHISRQPASPATVAGASSSVVTGRLSAKGVDADAAAAAWRVDSAMRTSPPAPLHASFDGFAQSSAAVPPLSAFSVAQAAPRPAAAQRRTADCSMVSYCFGTQGEHAEPLIPAAKFSSIDPPRASDAQPQVSTLSSLARKARAASGHPSSSLELEGNSSAVIRAAAVAAEAEGGVPQSALSSSPKPQSATTMIAAPAAASVSQLSHTPAIMLTTSLLGFSSRSPTPVTNSCATPFPLPWHPPHPMLPLQQLSAESTSSIYGGPGSGGGVVGGVGSNINASTTRSPLPEWPRLRTLPQQPACMPATRTSGEGHRVDSLSRMNISCGGGGVPPPYQSVPSLLSHSVWKSRGPGRPESPSPLGSLSEQCSGGIGGAGGDNPEGVAGAVEQHQHQPPACRLTAFKGLASDSHAQVGFGSVTADSDGAMLQATPVSPPPQWQHLKSHSGDIFAPTTTAARPPMTALGPVVRPWPHQRTSSNVSLLSSIAHSPLASGVGGSNGSDTATSTPPPLHMAIASLGVAPTLCTFSASSTFTGFGPAPSCILAAGPRSASISGKAYVHPVTTSPPPRYRRAGSASSLSSMGAFAFNDAGTAPVMHSGVRCRVAECVPPSTGSSTPRNRFGGRVDGGAENDADDVVHGDEGEDYLEDEGAGSCKATQGGNGRRWRVTSSGCGGGARCCGKPVRLKHGTAIETAIQAGAYARHPSCVYLFAGGGGSGGDASVGFSRAGVTSTAAAAAQAGDDGRWSGSEDPVTWLSCAASFTASSTSASTTYASSSFGTVPCDGEHEREDGLAVCTLYAAAPRHYHYRRTVDAPASCDAVFLRGREKRHHRYVRVHHPRRQHRSFTTEVNSTAARPILNLDPAANENVNAGVHNRRGQRPAVTALPGTCVPYSPHLSTSSLLYYDDVCSDDVDDVYYQIEKRLFPVADEAGQSLCRASRSSPPPPQTPAAAPSASPTGNTSEAPHDGSDEPSIDALFTVLNVPLRLNLRGGFHLSDYYAPCPVCHPAMRTAAEDTASGLAATASSCSCCSCRCSSVCFRSTRRSTLSSRAMSRMSGGTSPGSTQLIFSSDSSAKASASGFAMGLRQTTPPPPPPVPAALAGRQPGVSSAATATQPYGVGAATSASDTLSSLLLRHGGPLLCKRHDRQAAVTVQVDAKDKVRDPKYGSRGTRGGGDPGRLPPPLVVTAAHRHSRYRRQRARHPPAVVTARRRQAHHRGGGVGDGALRSQYSRFMRQRLLCVRVNDKITYIDPKPPTETYSAPPASRLPQQAATFRRHNRFRNSHHHRHQCRHTRGELRCCARDQRPQALERQRQSSTFSHTEAAPGARGSNERHPQQKNQAMQRVPELSLCLILLADGAPRAIVIEALTGVDNDGSTEKTEFIPRTAAPGSPRILVPPLQVLPQRSSHQNALPGGTVRKGR